MKPFNNKLLKRTHNDGAHAGSAKRSRAATPSLRSRIGNSLLAVVLAISMVPGNGLTALAAENDNGDELVAEITRSGATTDVQEATTSEATGTEGTHSEGATTEGETAESEGEGAAGEGSESAEGAAGEGAQSEEATESEGDNAGDAEELAGEEATEGEETEEADVVTTHALKRFDVLTLAKANAISTTTSDKPQITVRLKLYKQDGETLDASAYGAQLYAYVRHEWGNCCLALLTVDETGVATATITKMTDQNGAGSYDVQTGSYTVKLVSVYAAEGSNSDYNNTPKRELNSDSIIFGSYKLGSYENAAMVSGSNGAYTSPIIEVAATKIGNYAAVYSDIYDGLGVAKNFAVYANAFTNNADMEGNIACNDLKQGIEFGNSANVTSSDYDNMEITVGKSVVNQDGSVDTTANGTFKFGLYVKSGTANSNEQGILVETFNVEVSNGIGSTTVRHATGESELFSGDGVYSVWELDDNNQPLASGDKLGNYTVTYVNTQDGGASLPTSVSGSTPYEVNLPNGFSFMETLELNEGIQVSDNINFVGSTSGSFNKAKPGSTIVTVVKQSPDGTITYDPNNKIFSCTEITNTGGPVRGIGVLQDEFNRAVTGGVSSDGITGFLDGQLSSLSRSLACATSSVADASSVTSSDKVTVLYTKIGDLQKVINNYRGHGNCYAIDCQHDITSDDAVVVNVLIPNGTNEITLGGYEMYIGNTKVSKLDGWDSIARKLLWNYVYEDGTPYQGTINYNGQAQPAGTHLAPKAKFSAGNNKEATYIANEVSQSGGEIHKVTFHKDATRTVSVSCGNVNPRPSTGDGEGDAPSTGSLTINKSIVADPSTELDNVCAKVTGNNNIAFRVVRIDSGGNSSDPLSFIRVNGNITVAAADGIDHPNDAQSTLSLSDFVRSGGSFSCTISGLEPGSYQITETSNSIAGYTLQAGVTAGGTTTYIDTPVATETVSAGSSTAVSFTNKYTLKTGSIVLKKSAVSVDKDNQSTTLKDLTSNNSNISFKVQELDEDGKVVTELDENNNAVEKTLSFRNGDNGTMSYTHGVGEDTTSILKLDKNTWTWNDEEGAYTLKLTGLKANTTYRVVETNRDVSYYTLVEAKTHVNTTTREFPGHPDVPLEDSLIPPYADINVAENSDNPEKESEFTVLFVNTYKPNKGTLVVKKTLSGIDDADLSDAGNITFTVTDKNGGGEVTDSDGQAVNSKTVTVSELKSSGLHWGLSLDPGEYNVTETVADIDGYTRATTFAVQVTGNDDSDNAVHNTTAEAATSKSATVYSDCTTTVTISNTYTKQLGSLKVTKTINGDNLTEDQLSSIRDDITFTVTPPEGKTINGEASVSKKLSVFNENGEWLIEGLEQGTYTITENVGVGTPAGYNLIVNPTGGSTTATVTANGTAIAAFTNTYSKQVGHLTINKTFSGLNYADLTDNQKGGTVFTIKSGETVVATVNLKEHFTPSNDVLTCTIDLAPGNYTIEETSPDIAGYVHTVTISEDGNFSITDTGTSTVNVTNTYKPVGKLILTKTFSGLVSGLPEVTLGKIYFEITDPNGGKTTKHLTDFGNRTDENGQTYYECTIDPAAVGEYKIVEKDAAFTGFFLNATATVTVGNGTAAQCTDGDWKANVETNTTTVAAISNAYEQLGSLKLTKTIDAQTVSGDTTTEGNLSDEELSAVENVTTFTVVGPLDADGNNATGATETIVKLSDMKQSDGSGSYSCTLNNLKPGTYHVTENGADCLGGNGYTLSVSPQDDNGAGAGAATVVGGETATLAFANMYTKTVQPEEPAPEKGSLTITKNISGDALGESLQSVLDNTTFTIKRARDDAVVETIKLADMQSVNGSYSCTLTTLELGDYVITENGYELEGYQLAVSPDSKSITVTVGSDKTAQSATAAFENTYTKTGEPEPEPTPAPETGSLTITKGVVGLDEGDKTAAIDGITVTVTKQGVDGVEEQITSKSLSEIVSKGSWTISDLNAGTYIITESGPNLTGELADKYPTFTPTANGALPSSVNTETGQGTFAASWTTTVPGNGQDGVRSVDITNTYKPETPKTPDNPEPTPTVTPVTTRFNVNIPFTKSFLGEVADVPAEGFTFSLYDANVSFASDGFIASANIASGARAINTYTLTAADFASGETTTGSLSTSLSASSDGPATTTKYYILREESNDSAIANIQYDTSVYVIGVTLTRTTAADTRPVGYTASMQVWDSWDEDNRMFAPLQTTVNTTPSSAGGFTMSLPASTIEFTNNSDDSIALFQRSLDAVVMYSGIEAETWVDPKVAKVLNGAELKEDQFTFQLREVDEQGNPVDSNITTQTNDIHGVVDFDARGEYINPNDGQRYLFYFTEPGTHWYAITEVNDGQPDVIYDTRTVYFKIDVFKQGDGALDYTDGFYESINGQAIPEDETPTFTNTKEGVDLRVQKRSKDGSHDPLAGATYGLWMVNDSGRDVYLGSEVSDENGWITFHDIALETGRKYYFKEEAAPEGHLVDIYRSKYFTVVPDGNGALKLMYEGEDGFEGSTS